jgi:hypothetical protein
MSETSKNQHTTTALSDDFKSENINLATSYINACNEVCEHLPNSYVFLLKDPTVTDINDPLYQSSVIGDIKSLIAIKRNLPVIIQNQDEKIADFTNSVFYNLGTFDGRELLISMFRTQGEMNQESFPSLNDTLGKLDTKIDQDRTAWNTKFGENRHIKNLDLDGALTNAKANPTSAVEIKPFF